MWTPEQGLATQREWQVQELRCEAVQVMLEEKQRGWSGWGEGVKKKGGKEELRSEE